MLSQQDCSISLCRLPLSRSTILSPKPNPDPDPGPMPPEPDPFPSPQPPLPPPEPAPAPPTRPPIPQLTNRVSRQSVVGCTFAYARLASSP